MQKKTTPDVWVRFLAGPEEALAHLIKRNEDITNYYHIRNIVSINGKGQNSRRAV
ncbi:MAG: hypothetical protein HYU02_04430 [Thaumarchaeota archaeon]|nr:hypothetical protein [Nitrososphaerota archaeon]